MENRVKWMRRRAISRLLAAPCFTAAPRPREFIIADADDAGRRPLSRARQKRADHALGRTSQALALIFAE